MHTENVLMRMREDNVVLYTRSDVKGTTIQMRIRIPNVSGGYIRRTTGHKTLEYAMQVAGAEYDRLVGRRNTGGLSELPKTFRALADQFIAALELDAERHAVGTKELRLKEGKLKSFRHNLTHTLLHHFGKMNAEEIQEPQINEYVTWRRSLHKTDPRGIQKKRVHRKRGRDYERKDWAHKAVSDQTIRIELSTVAAVFTWAARNGKYERKYMPNFGFGKIQKNKRSAFSLDNMKHLESFMPGWANAYKKSFVIYRRHRIKALVMLMAYSGARIGEIKPITWNLIKGDDLFITDEGKVREKRQCKMMADAVAALKEWRIFQTQFFGSPMKGDEMVFVDWDRKSPLIEHDSGMRSLLKAADLDKDAYGMPMTAYGFRHFYIGYHLKQGESAYDIAKQCGTSVEMIRSYYDHIVDGPASERMSKGMPNDAWDELLDLAASEVDTDEEREALDKYRDTKKRKR